MDGFRVVSHMVADFEQQSDGKLPDSVGAVGRDIGDTDTFLPGILVIHNVVARGKNRNILHIRAGVKDRFADGAFVGEDHFGVPDAFNNHGVIVGGAVVDRQVAEGFQRFPAEVAGVFGIAVEDHDFHRAFLLYLLSLYSAYH